MLSGIDVSSYNNIARPRNRLRTLTHGLKSEKSAQTYRNWNTLAQSTKLKQRISFQLALFNFKYKLSSLKHTNIASFCRKPLYSTYFMYLQNVQIND